MHRFIEFKHHKFRKGKDKVHP